MIKIGIIGGGINGLFISWQLGKLGYAVDLYESDQVLQKTSSSSSKLLHGGIRYLEQGHIGLVRESLLDRAWWLKNAPDFCKPIEICMPIYESSPRSALKLYAGAQLYRILAGSFSLGPTRWRNKNKTEQLFTDIDRSNLKSSVSFFDAQMDEKNLGAWVCSNAKNCDVNIYEHTKVDRFSPDGQIYSSQLGLKKYNFVINAAGPWAAQMNEDNNVDTKFYLRLIKGSHIILDQKVSGHYLFQESEGNRIVFVLPYLGQTLVGTTEVPQDIYEKITCSQEERDYLICIFNNNFINKVNESNIVQEFSGLRPIVGSHLRKMESYFSFASREAEIESVDRLLTIYGGKWTSAPSLSRKVVRKINYLRS